MTKHGDQFDGDRYDTGTGNEEIKSHYVDCWNPRNIIACEPGEVFDNYAEEKALHQILDYSGMDYVIDPLDAPAFGVNHREHTPTDSELRFDIRTDTGTAAPSELEKVRHANDSLSLAPQYASRLKQSGKSADWVRIIDLYQLSNAIDAGLQPTDTWTDGDVTAWFFDYGLLDKMDAIVYESKGGYND